MKLIALLSPNTLLVQCFNNTVYKQYNFLMNKKAMVWLFFYLVKTYWTSCPTKLTRNFFFLYITPLNCCFLIDLFWQNFSLSYFVLCKMIFFSFKKHFFVFKFNKKLKFFTWKSHFPFKMNRNLLKACRNELIKEKILRES